MEYLIHLAILFAIYAILGISLNLVVGYAGLLSVTQSAFYGIGAYVTAILLTQSGIGFFLSVILVIIITAVVSFLMGIVLSKFDDDYFALGSFGFNIIIFSIFLNWQDLTRGQLGIPGISRPVLFGFNFSQNAAFLVLVIIILGGLANLKGSILGALFLILLPEILRFVGFPTEIAAQMRQVVYGVILILLMLYRPQGLIGEYKL